MSFDTIFDASYTDSSTYPNLGFNPAPGIPADVEALENALNKCTSSIPSLASKVPGLAKLGENAVSDFGDMAESGSNLVKAFSKSAHSTTVVSGAIGAVNRVGKIVNAGEDVLNVSASAVRNITFGMKAGSVAHNLYSDVQAAF